MPAFNALSLGRQTVRGQQQEDDDDGKWQKKDTRLAKVEDRPLRTALIDNGRTAVKLGRSASRESSVSDVSHQKQIVRVETRWAETR